MTKVITVALCMGLALAVADASEPASAPAAEPESLEDVLAAPAKADPAGALVEYYGTKLADDLEPVAIEDVDPWMEPWFRDYDAKDEVKRAEAMIEYLRKKRTAPEEDPPEPE